MCHSHGIYRWRIAHGGWLYRFGNRNRVIQYDPRSRSKPGKNPDDVYPWRDAIDEWWKHRFRQLHCTSDYSCRWQRGLNSPGRGSNLACNQCASASVRLAFVEHYHRRREHGNRGFLDQRVMDIQSERLHELQFRSRTHAVWSWLNPRIIVYLHL